MHAVPQPAPLRPVRQNPKTAINAELGLSHMVLRGCGNCGHAHPLAAKGAMYVVDGVMTVSPEVDPDHCPGCGADVVRPQGWVDTTAQITGWTPIAIAARAMLGLGKFFADLARRMK